jgi:plastocyanin
VAPSRRRATGVAALLTVAVCLLAAGSAFAADQRVVTIRDDCDPVTFNAAGVPCIGDGRTPIGELVAAAQANDPLPQWRFSRPDFNIDAGGTIHVVNEGGEAHTFTMVPQFGNGCIDVLNPKAKADQPPAVPCDTIVPILPGGTADVTVGSAGTVRFQCMIHPWMHSVVDVRDRGED